MRYRLPLSALVVAVACAALWAAGSLTLAYTPEKGLRIPYDIHVSGHYKLRVTGQPTKEAGLRLDARRIDVVKEVNGKSIVLERTIEKAVMKRDGTKVELPDKVVGEPMLFNVDSEAHVECQREDPWPEGTEMFFIDALNLVETVPFAPGAVEVGDTWDASSPSDKEDQPFLHRLHMKSEGKLLRTYDSNGMAVALIAQEVDSQLMIDPMMEQSASRPVSRRLTLRASILQSNRVEDGALLGIRGRLNEKIEYVLPNGQVSVTEEMPDLEGTLEVAAE